MCTESRIDLSHSQPFWVHGVPDLATVHNGHITNYHQLRRRFEQRGVTFYTDNDSEVIGVYLRARMERGRSLPEAMADSIRDLDGSFCYLVASSEGLGVVRDRFGFKPMMLAETDEFVAAATEEIALRRAFPRRLPVSRAAPGSALFFPLTSDRPSTTRLAIGGQPDHRRRSCLPMPTRRHAPRHADRRPTRSSSIATAAPSREINRAVREAIAAGSDSHPPRRPGRAPQPRRRPARGGRADHRRQRRLLRRRA